MITRLNELHSLIIYIIFGYTLLLPLVLASLRFFNINGAVQRLHIYLVAFLTPPVAFVIYHTLLVKRCESGLPPLWSENTFHLLCTITEGMLIGFVPLLGLLSVIAVLRATAAVLMVRRLEKKAVTIENELSDFVYSLVIEKSKKLGMASPRVIFIRRDDFAAFTIGFIKPIIVINYDMVKFLTKREIEAVISHELVHVKNSDSLKNWILYFIRDVVILNPLSALLLRGYMTEKEVICDQKAAELVNQKPQEYASVLLKVWRSLADRQKESSALASNFTGSNDMERRVQALLDSSHGSTAISNGAVLFSGVILFLTTLFFLGLIC